MAPPPWRFDQPHKPFEASASNELRRWATLESKSDTTRDDLLREAAAPPIAPPVSRAFTLSILLKTAVYMSRVLFTDR